MKFNGFPKVTFRDGEMAQQLKCTVHSRGPSSVPSTHNRQFTTTCISSSGNSHPLLASAGTRYECLQVNTHTHKIKIKKKILKSHSFLAIRKWYVFVFSCIFVFFPHVCVSTSSKPRVSGIRKSFRSPELELRMTVNNHMYAEN